VGAVSQSTTRKLRDYQTEAVKRTEARHADGDLALAGVAATGLGKSTILGETIVRHLRRNPGQRAVVFAHRTELCDQLTETIAELAPDLPVGRVQGQRNQCDRRIVVATIDTVRQARGSGEQLTLPRLARLTDRRLPPIGIVGYDEFHHSAAPTNRRVLDALDCAGPEATVPMLGVTATLTRADRYGLGDLAADPPAFSYDTVFGIANGYLVRPHGKVVIADHLDLNKAKVTAGDYQDGQLGEMVAQDAEQIVQAWLDHAENRVTAAFFPTVDSAREMLRAFTERGVSAEIVTGTTPTGDGMFRRGSAERGTGIYGRLARGETRVLVGVMVTTEGWDCPPVSCILMGRPTRLEHVYQQIVGRGLRPVSAELVALRGWVAKTDCLILDVVGASRGQKLVSLIDLVPTAEVDLSALDNIPCEVCHHRKCTCNVGMGERDPDGGRRRLRGPAFYEDFDLLLSTDGAGDRWLATDAGHPVLVPAGLDRFAVILQERSGLYRVGTVAKRGRANPERIGQALDLDAARRCAEDWAINQKPYLANRNAAWRTRSAGPPGGKDWWKAKKLGCTDPGAYTAAELADWIAVREASMRMDLLGQGAAAQREPTQGNGSGS
jgi:superfamily II DNA or RNA helicase